MAHMSSLYQLQDFDPAIIAMGPSAMFDPDIVSVGLVVPVDFSNMVNDTI